MLKHGILKVSGEETRGIAHRDITSGNLLLRRDMSLAVADFGSATWLDEMKNGEIAAQV